VIVLDASVLIAQLDDRDAQHGEAVSRLLAHATHPFGASAITLAEVYVGPARSGQLDVAQRAISDLGVRQIPVGEDAPARLAALRAATKLKLPDCCVLLAAQDVKATAVLTLDHRLAREAAELGFSPAR
jgi:predicted nucleic acid-binding protein